MTETLIAPRPVIRLVADEHGHLYFPQGGHRWPAAGSDAKVEYDCPDEPHLLVYRYPAGDVDLIPWPLQCEFSTHEQLVERLKGALFDERECNSFFPSDAIIELPDGTEFDF